jgi:hypothetical protein
MKITPGLTIAVLTFTAGVLVAAGWSASIGRKVWSPRVFGWRNFLKPQPIIEEQPGSPLHIVDTRFYSFMSIGSSVGSVLKLDFKNVSSRPIHSFSVSYYSPDPLDTGSFGCQPQTFLQPEHLETTGVSSRGRDRVKLSVDFVQFADGDVWYSDPLKATVKPEGVRAGAQAATKHLLRILESDGAAAVIDALPRIRADVASPDFSTREVFGYFGFYCGVTNIEVRVQHAYQEGGLLQVEDLLRRQRY